MTFEVQIPANTFPDVTPGRGRSLADRFPTPDAQAPDAQTRSAQSLSRGPQPKSRCGCGPAIISRTPWQADAANPKYHARVEFGRPGQLTIDAQDMPLLPPQPSCVEFGSMEQFIQWTIARFNAKPVIDPSSGNLIGSTLEVIELGQPLAVDGAGTIMHVGDVTDYLATGGTGRWIAGDVVETLFQPRVAQRDDVVELLDLLPASSGLAASSLCRVEDHPEDDPDDEEEDEGVAGSALLPTHMARVRGGEKMCNDEITFCWKGASWKHKGLLRGRAWAGARTKVKKIKGHSKKDVTVGVRSTLCANVDSAGSGSPTIADCRSFPVHPDASGFKVSRKRVTIKKKAVWIPLVTDAPFEDRVQTVCSSHGVLESPIGGVTTHLETFAGGGTLSPDASGGIPEPCGGSGI